jgi:hypothetical protein
MMDGDPTPKAGGFSLKKIPPKTWAIVIVVGGIAGLYLRKRKGTSRASAVPTGGDAVDDTAYSEPDYGRSPMSYPYAGAGPNSESTDPIYGAVASVRDQVEQETIRRIQAGIGTGTPSTPTPTTPPTPTGPNVDSGGSIVVPAASQTAVEAARVAATGGNPYAGGYRPRFAPK